MIKRYLFLALVVLAVTACRTAVTPLEVTELVPEPSATNVAIDVVLTATFNRALDADSVDGTFTLSGGGSNVPGVLDYDAPSRTVTFTPDDDLAYDTEYTATVSGSIRARSGDTLAGDVSWSFTTEADPDPVVPGVASVTIDGGDRSLTVGESASLAVTVVVTGGASQEVSWSSSDAAIVSVDSNGTITGEAVGSAEITATSDFDADVSDTITVTVVEDDPVLLSIAATAAAAGDFETLLAALAEAGLAATFDDDDAGPFTVFAPTDEAFDDLLTALGATPAELLAREDLGAILAYHVLDGEFLAAAVVALINDGGGTATVPTLLPDFDLTLTLDDNSVIINGDVTVTVPDILATNGVIHVIDAVLVPLAIGGISVEPEAADMVVGDELALDVSFSDVIGVPDLGVTWVSDDETVATVDADGVVSALDEGTATITATSDFDPSLSAEVEITVWTPLAATPYDVEIGYLVNTPIADLTTDVSGGAEPYSFDLSGDLPAGLTFDDSDGTIAGTPTEVGSFDVTVTIGDAIGQEVELEATINVAGVMSVTSFLDDTQGAGTTIEPLTIVVAGGLAPFTFEVTPDPGFPDPNGPLAPGLTLDEDGVISGTLTTANFYRTFITTTDALGQTGVTMVEIDVLLVLNYTGSPYAYPVGCGGEVFAGSVACPAGDEPLGTQGNYSAITPVASIEVLGASGVLSFSWSLQTEDLLNGRWEISSGRGVIFRRNNGTQSFNVGDSANSERTYLVTVFDDGSNRTAQTLVTFVPEADD